MLNPFNVGVIGYTGFVGGTLCNQHVFTHFYRSTNIEEICQQKFDLVVCCGAPGKKWLANQQPEKDLQALKHLMSCLEKITCTHFVLISTIDVFKNPVSVNEASLIDESGLHAYGLHRRLLEKFVEQRFSRHLIVRLPGLVGPGLRKNIIFDFLNNNQLSAIHSESTFQFYPIVNLWYDIQIALQADLPLIHLTTEPLSVATLAKQGFGREFNQILPGTIVRYDIQSLHDKLLGGQQGYHYNKREVIQAVRAYAQSEPKTARVGAC